MEPLANYSADTIVEYRLAYVAFCIRDCKDGQRLREDFRWLVHIDPKNIQFGSPEWFLHEHVNSYALQVEPERFQYKDTAQVGIEEALVLEKTRNTVFEKLRSLVLQLLSR
jgi:hypothetical protein